MTDMQWGMDPDQAKILQLVQLDTACLDKAKHISEARTSVYM